MTPSLKNRVLGWMDTIYYIVKNLGDLGRAEAEMERDREIQIRKAEGLKG